MAWEVHECAEYYIACLTTGPACERTCAGMCAQVGQASAQIPVNITLFGFSTPNVTVYGQSTSFVATLTVDPGNPLPTGNLLFLNGNNILATAPLATAGQASGNQLVGLLSFRVIS